MGQDHVISSLVYVSRCPIAAVTTVYTEVIVSPLEYSMFITSFPSHTSWYSEEYGSGVVCRVGEYQHQLVWYAAYILLVQVYWNGDAFFQ